MSKRIKVRAALLLAGCVLWGLFASPGAFASPAPVRAVSADSAAPASPVTATAATYRFQAPFHFPKETYFCLAGGKGCLVFQNDGNMVIYYDGAAHWNTGTNGRGCDAVWQSDGNLVVYDCNGNWIWQSGTNNRGCRLDYQDDGNLVIYDCRGNWIWQSGTNH